MSTNKKITKKKRITQKDVGEIKQKTSFERLRDHYTSIPMQPSWIGLGILVVYFLIKPGPENEIDYFVYFTIISLVMSATGFIAIRRNVFPGLTSMYVGVAATMLGWLSLILGTGLAILSAIQIILNY